jgi:LysM repeat protein
MRLRPIPLIMLLAAACSSAPAAPTPTLQAALPLSLLPGGSVTLAAPASTARPTPAFVATPLPTATPVLHVIQKGDTLIGIALQYGVSVEALQDANGGIAPEALQIGSTLVIPVSGTQAAVSVGLPTPLPLELGPATCYPESSGAMYCFCEARNPGTVALEGIEARMLLVGPDGVPAAEAAALPALHVLLPGKTTPLGAFFSTTASAEQSVVAQLASAYPVAERGVRFVALDVVSQAAEPGGIGWRARAMVLNSSGQDVRSVWVVLALYGRDGAVAGYRAEEIVGTLAAGAQQEYEIQAAALGGPVDHYMVMAEGVP